MHNSNHIFLLLSVFHLASTFTFSESSNLLSNATQTPLLNLTSSSLLPSEALQCDLPGTAPPLDEDDCFDALGLLPSQSTNARFHGGSGRDFHKLPRNVSQGQCRINIDLVDHVTEEQSSWDEIYGGAYSLLSYCVESENGLGGNILVGYHLRIRVTMQYIFDEEARGRSNNSAILSGRTSSSSPPLGVPEPYCYPPGTGNAPELRDCFEVLHRFPKSTLRRTYHRAGASDGYRLPVIGQHQTCEVSVTLVEGVQEEESRWAIVYLAASLLTSRCVHGGAHVGGEIFVGERDHIRVTVQYFMLESIGKNNSTMLSKRTSPSPTISAVVPSCYPPGTGYQLSRHDCLVAQYWMPGSTTEGTFHEAGADDGRRLPIRYSHQTCDIFVELVDGVQEERSTWVTIGWETWILIFRCVIQGVHLGGEILVGEGNHIRVTVKNPVQEAKGTITAGDIE